MSSTQDTPMDASGTVPEQELKYGGFTRFEIELEFVQCLANPHYISHLATLTAPTESNNNASSSSSTPTPLLSHPPFVAYLAYLQYFAHPPYTKYLTYPGPTLKNLALLQSERFRREILSPEVVGAMVMRGAEAAERWHVG